MNPFNLKNEEIQQCKVFIIGFFINASLNSVKGTIERIEENDDQRKRTSERTSVQTRPLSDKVNQNFLRLI
jgi:hypothetical protein